MSKPTANLVAEYLARGGKITRCPTAKPSGVVTATSKGEPAPEREFSTLEGPCSTYLIMQHLALYPAARAQMFRHSVALDYTNPHHPARQNATKAAARAAKPSSGRKRGGQPKRKLTSVAA